MSSNVATHRCGEDQREEGGGRAEADTAVRGPSSFRHSGILTGQEHHQDPDREKEGHEADAVDDGGGGMGGVKVGTWDNHAAHRC